jgi:nucleoid-associated protein YgaU
MTTPLSLLKQGLTRAYLVIVQPTNMPEPIPVCFNPTEYQVAKQNSFADIAIPGLQAPPIQFIRGDCAKLTTELLCDTSDTLEDVRARYTDKLRALMDIQAELHAPPIVRFIWDKNVFEGVVESLTITFQMFTPDGVPIRAKLAISLKEYQPATVSTRDPPRNSPDVDKAYVVRSGDTLSSIAEAAYQDPGQWRLVAAANGIQDPRSLVPGTTLSLPRLR